MEERKTARILRRSVTIFADENGAVSRGAGLQKQVGQPSYGESTPNNSIAKETEKSNTEIDAGDTAFEYDAETESVNEQHQLLTWEASDYVTERNKAAKEMAEKLGISQKKARDNIDSVNSVAKYILRGCRPD